MTGPDQSDHEPTSRAGDSGLGTGGWAAGKGAPSRQKSQIPSPKSEIPHRPPLQFGLRAMLWIMVAVSLLFGTLRWLDVSASASAMVLVILIVSVAAALGLVVAIAAARDDDR